MATKTAGSNPTASASMGALYSAVEDLRDLAIEAFGGLENDGDLLQLRDQLGEIRDRANSVQDATMAFISAINEYL